MGKQRILTRQRGVALLIFMILLVTAALTYVVNSLTPEAVEARRAQKTREALVTARDALVGYALKYRDEQIAQGQFDRVNGYLPLPDLGSTRNNNTACTLEGCDAANFSGNALNSSVVGRLPWRALGLPPLRDGYNECLWLVVSGSHQRQQRVTPMNWDTLGQLDIVVANGTGALASALATAHERPVAVIYSPGPPLPGQDRSPPASPPPAGDDVTQCGGNYNAANYLDPAAALALGGITNYLAGTNNASLVTGDVNPANDPDTPKSLHIQGKVFTAGGNYLPHACQGSGCTLVANDTGLALTGDMLFGSIRKSNGFLGDINSMLDRMVNCLRDQPPPGGTAARISDNTCYDGNQHPLGYYDHYKEMIFLAKPTAPFTVNGDTTCAGVLIFAGQRSGTQGRVGAEKNVFSNYLEAPNFPLTGTSFTGPALFERSPPQTPEQDTVRCIPAGPTFAPVTSPALAALGLGQLAAYDTTTRTLTLGKANVVTGVIGNANAGALFGCAWIAESRPLGNGVRTYFRFRFKRVGTNVGSNGFVFALADAERNSPAACGAAGSHLGYSGSNGTTKIASPKIGIEFDQGRNAGFSEHADPTLSGRNDPCGTTAAGCAGLGYNTHAAIVYWGNMAANAADLVAQPDFDDNVHGYPATPPATRPPPTNPTYPSAGFAFKDLRGKASEGGDSYLYHVRLEITPTRNAGAAAENSTTTVQTRVWLLADSITVANQIAAMKNTTRPMSQLYPTFNPDLQDTATLYDVAGASCASDPCPTGETCGTDNICYRQALRTLRPGFTGSQRTTDQEVLISDFFASWIP